MKYVARKFQHSINTGVGNIYALRTGPQWNNVWHMQVYYNS